MRDDDNGRRESIGTGTRIGIVKDHDHDHDQDQEQDQEQEQEQEQGYKIRGRSTTTSIATTKDVLNPSIISASSPVATEPLPSPPIHPDRRANFFNAAIAPALASAPAPAPAHFPNKVDYPPSPLSRSPEHINHINNINNINHLNHINNAEPEEQRRK